MAIRKNSLNITQVAQDATKNFVAPKPLATNEAVRTQIVQETPAPKPMRRVCTIQKVGGFTFFTSEDDRNALDYIAFRQKLEKQNIVRAALHQFIRQHYHEGQGLDAEALRIIEQYEDSVYQWV